MRKELGRALWRTSNDGQAQRRRVGKCREAGHERVAQSAEDREQEKPGSAKLRTMKPCRDHVHRE